MKKILFALAAAAMAVCAQAASIDWSIGANTWTLDGGSKAAKGTSVYLINTANLAAIQTALEGGATSFTTATAGILAVGSTSNTKGQVLSSTATSSSLVAGTSYDVAYMVIQDGKYFVSGSQSVQAYDLSDPVYNEANGATFTAAAFTSPTASWGPTQTGGGGGGGGEGVPEPTSGLLLVLGGAMLALRRKQK